MSPMHLSCLFKKDDIKLLIFELKSMLMNLVRYFIFVILFWTWKCWALAMRRWTFLSSDWIWFRVDPLDFSSVKVKKDVENAICTGDYGSVRLWAKTEPITEIFGYLKLVTKWLWLWFVWLISKIYISIRLITLFFVWIKKKTPLHYTLIIKKKLKVKSWKRLNTIWTTIKRL